MGIYFRDKILKILPYLCFLLDKISCRRTDCDRLCARRRETCRILSLRVEVKSVAVTLDDRRTHAALCEEWNELFNKCRLARARGRCGNGENGTRALLVRKTTACKAIGSGRVHVEQHPRIHRKRNFTHGKLPEDELGFSLSVILREGGEERLSSYIAQPLIRGRVVTVDILRDRFGNTASIPREELLRTPNGAGLSVRVFQDRNFQRVCEYLAERLNVLGCVNFEFIRGEGSGVYYFVECNPRFSGGVAFTELSGFPAVEESLRIFDGERLRTDYPLRYGYFTRKYTECRMKR